MVDDLNLWTELNKFQNSRVDRRRLLQLLGYGLAGIASVDILAACGGSAPPVSVTATPSATVTTSLQTTRPLTPYFLGYNDEAIHTLAWSNMTFAQAAAQLKPGTLRYPGGTVANYWDWQKGWFFPNLPGHTGFLNLTTKTYRLQEFQQGIQATGATPIYVLNMLTSDLDYQLEMLRTAKSMGLPVKLVEMGNEFFIDDSDNVAKFPTGQDYGQVTTSWIQAIRKEFPGVQIAAVGGLPAGGTPNDHGRRRKWTQDVLQTLRGADALTLHPYVDIKSSEVSKDISATSSEAMTAAQRIVTALAPMWQQIQVTLKVMPSNMDVWFTEYNLTDQVGDVHFRWLQGIFVASMVFTFLEENRSALSCIYDMTCGNGGFESIGCSNASQGYQGESNVVTPYALTAVGWAMQLMNDTMSGMTSAQQMSFEPNLPVNTNGGTASPDSLMGWLFADGTRRQALILNRSANAFAWQGSSAIPQGSQFKQLSSDPFKLITSPDSLTMNSGPLQGQLILPPYSLTQIK